MYTDPLIAGTNRKAYLLHASYALKDSHCHWSSIIDFTEDQQLMSEHSHTHIYHNGISAEGDLTNEDEERLVMWHSLIYIEKVELVKTTIWVFGDKVTVSVIKTSKKSLYEVW